MHANFPPTSGPSSSIQLSHFTHSHPVKRGESTAPSLVDLHDVVTSSALVVAAAVLDWSQT